MMISLVTVRVRTGASRYVSAGASKKGNKATQATVRELLADLRATSPPTSPPIVEKTRATGRAKIRQIKPSIRNRTEIRQASRILGHGCTTHIKAFRCTTLSDMYTVRKPTKKEPRTRKDKVIVAVRFDKWLPPTESLKSKP